MMLQYKYPWIYKILIPIIHRKSVLKIFSEEVGKNVSVFDVACGFGQMEKYIDSSNVYSGIDLNEEFIIYAQKRGRQVEKGNIFDPGAYKKSDTVVLVDVVHHIPEKKLKELFDLVYSNAKERVVVMEPAFLNLKSRYGVFGGIVDWVFKKLDSDGVNEIERWFNEEEYIALFENRFGSREGNQFKLRLKKIHPYFIATFYKK
ncbi:MAG: class I SAM-dependent methyltransferase [Candidatus Spechtbacterales bacterium]